MPLKDLKESNSVETVEFAMVRGIADEAAFAWWVPYTLKKRDVIIGKVQARFRKTTHKYIVKLPSSIDNAKQLDRKNNNSLWCNALAKEMYNVGVAFEVLDEGKGAPPRWHKVTGHLCWDVKLNFERKARWVLDGHKTANPVGSTYAGFVSRESVRISFTIEALNGVDVCAADIRNAYLQAPYSRKDCIICGIEFGFEHEGKVALIHHF